MRTFAIAPADEGRTLSSLLRNALPGAPRALLRKWARDAATVDGAAADPDRPLRAGQVVALRESGRMREFAAAGPAPVDVLRDDADWVAVAKPAGQAVHPTDERDGDDLLSRAAALGPLLGLSGDWHAVNRLDRWTSGVVLLAPGAARAAALARCFAERQVDKRYLAVVAGTPPDEGTVDLPVDGRPAQTRFEVLARGPAAALVLARPATGRRHQVRRHLAATGHPLVGDRRYGGPAADGVGGALLHAVSLGFLHPVTGAAVTVVAPVPAAFRQAMADLGIPADVLAAILAG